MNKDNSKIIKSIFYISFDFIYSNKKRFFLSLLSYLLPFLFFFPILFVGLSIQSSFLIDFESRFPLVEDDLDSLQYYFTDYYTTNTSQIPYDLLDRVFKDIDDIIDLSNLEKYIKGYYIYCKASLFFYYKNNFLPLTFLFCDNNTLSQLSNYLVMQNNSLNTFTEAILIRNTDSSKNFLPELSIGDNISIMPQSHEEEKLITNNSFLFPPLICNVNNFFEVNSFILENVINKNHPFTSNFISRYFNEIENELIFLQNLDFLVYVLKYFPTLLLSEISFHVQFIYDFSEYKYQDLKIIEQQAKTIEELSGFSRYHQLKTRLLPELSNFLSLYHKHIQRQWLRIFAFCLPTFLFSLYVLWISFSSNQQNLADAYSNLMIKGFSQKKIIGLFLTSHVFVIIFSSAISLIVSIPIAYFLLKIIADSIKISALNLRLVSFGSVFIPFCLLFLVLILFSLYHLIHLYKKVERYFPQPINSVIVVSTNSSSHTQTVVATLTTIFSIIGIGAIFLINKYIKEQTGTITSELSLLLNIFLYVLIILGTFGVLYVAITSILARIISFSNKIWKRSSSNLALVFHNLSLAFRHHKNQILFIALNVMIITQSLLFPMYLSKNTEDSSKFYLGSDASIKLNNNNETSAFLKDVSLFPYIVSISNYSIVQVKIFDMDYRILVISKSFASTVFYSKNYDFGFTLSELDKLFDFNNSIMVQSKDIINIMKQTNDEGDVTVELNYNNMTVNGTQYKQKYHVCGSFNIFPILLNDNQLSSYNQGKFCPFLVMTDRAFSNIYKYKDEIMINVITSAIIVKIDSKSNIQKLQFDLDSLPYLLYCETWLDVYSKYLPSFAIGIVSLFIISGFFALVSFLGVSIIFTQDLINERQSKILVLRYRGFSKTRISHLFLIEYLLILSLILPFCIIATVGISVYALILLQAETWILNLTYYSRITLLIFFTLVFLFGLDFVIRHFIQRKYIEFHPSIMEGT
ncbi:MAG: hypothetical protein ACTSQE_10665 [Candidatus Heimdallarchaeaceae archaeon]